MTSKDIQTKIDDLQKDLEQAKIREHVNLNKDSAVMAEVMHEGLCVWNHTDGCDWAYGSWEKPTFARGQYLKRANAFFEAFAGMDKKLLIEIATVLLAVKRKASK